MNVLFLLSFPAFLFSTQVRQTSEYAKELESTYLQPVILGQHSELLQLWQSALECSLSDEELLCKAEAIAASYQVWRRRRDLAVRLVFSDPNIKPQIAANVECEDLSALSACSKHWPESVQGSLSHRYMRGEKVDWPLLIKDIRKCTGTQRPALIRFLREHWPRHPEGGLVSGMLLGALTRFKESLQNPKAYFPSRPYIPCHFVLYHALFNENFPAEAFFYEDGDVIDAYGGKFFGVFEELKLLLDSGDENIISQLRSLFPSNVYNGPIRDVCGGNTDEKCLASILFHKDTNHDALLDHLERLADRDNMKAFTRKIPYLLMHSDLSTRDVLLAVGHLISDDYIFAYDHRALEIISIRGFKGQAIDNERLLYEGFQGPYSKEIAKLMRPEQFLSLALLVGADDEFLMSAAVDGPKEVPNFLLRSAVMTGRSVQLVEFLFKTLEGPNRASFVPYQDARVPMQHLKCLFQEDRFALAYTSELLNAIGVVECKLRFVLQLLTRDQLATLLNPLSSHKNVLILYDELIEQLRTDKRDVIEAHFRGQSDRITFEIALLSRSSEALEEIFNETKDEFLKNAVRSAISTKHEYQ